MSMEDYSHTYSSPSSEEEDGENRLNNSSNIWGERKSNFEPINENPIQKTLKKISIPINRLTQKISLTTANTSPRSNGILKTKRKNKDCLSSMSFTLWFFLSLVCIIFILGILILIIIFTIPAFYFFSEADTLHQKLIDPFYNENITQWIGGDGFASIYVTFGKGKDFVEYSIYMFGDSLIGKVDSTGARVRPKGNKTTLMVHNCLGVLSDEMDHIELFIKHNKKGEVISWFESNIKKHVFDPAINKTIEVEIYFWLMAGNVIGPHNSSSIHTRGKESTKGKPREEKQKIFFFTPRVYNIPGMTFFTLDGSGVLGCTVTRNTILKPSLWDCEYHDILLSNNLGIDIGFIGNIVIEEYVFMYVNKISMNEMALARVKIEEFLRYNFTEIEYFVEGNLWVNYNDLYDEKTKKGKYELKALKGLPKTTETTINYNEKMKRYYTIQIPKNDPSDINYDVNIYISEKIEGPYEKYFLYKIPPPFSTTNFVNAYGMKSHPELAKADNEIVFSYNTNSWPPDKFLDMFYEKELKEMVIPQYVSVKVFNIIVLLQKKK